MEKEGVRLNKYLSEAGVCSRREADRLIEAGEVTVDGKKAEMGMKVTDGMDIRLKGKKVFHHPEPIVLAVNKPVGVVCTTSRDDPANIVDYVGYPERVYPVGRLDKNSEGLILMTNQGEWMDAILRSSHYHEKEYVVTVDKPVVMEFLKAMREGVWLQELERKTRPCTVEKLAYNRFRIVLTQGLNRQIRRMCEALGYRVVSLRRVRVCNILLGNQPLGTWRKISGEELETLLEMIRSTK